MVSLYCGAGGFDLGFAQAGFEPVHAIDIDPFAVDTYNGLEQLTAGGHKAEVADVAADGSVPDSLAGVDLVIGGPPCQGFSVAGKMDPADPRAAQVFAFLDVVDRLRPAAFVMENVAHLAEHDRWDPIRQELLRRVMRLGYHDTTVVVDASAFGVPQKRRRMFLIGLRDQAAPIVLRPRDPMTVREALSALPRWGEAGNDDLCAARIVPVGNPVMRLSPYAGMLMNGAGRPVDLDGFAPTIVASAGGNKTPFVDQDCIDDPDADPWIVGYHAHLMGGGQPYTEVPDRLRRLTVQESAALMTFPAGMVWSGEQSARFRQIGNAVPPLMGRAVAEAVVAALDGTATGDTGSQDGVTDATVRQLALI